MKEFATWLLIAAVFLLALMQWGCDRKRPVQIGTDSTARSA